MNKLYYGDNLHILQEHIADESVDLIYLDPPFNSNRSYNVLFKDETGNDAEAQITAFEDTWHWNQHTEETYEQLVTGGTSVAGMLSALRFAVGTNQMMAYLVMMAARLVELHRVLKPTGSLYLHCDPTASHYLKIIMDTIFGVKNFRNEIIWKRTSAKGLAFTRFANNHDIIFYYSKNDEFIWNQQHKPHDENYIKKFYRYIDSESGRRYRLDNLANPNKNRPNLTYEFLGVTRVWRWTKKRMQKAYDDGLVIQTKPGSVPAFKRYLDEQEGTPVDDTWIDILPVQSQSGELLGYPTQKPLSLLERILKASSNEGDVVLDPFCGCGTTIAAAQKLNRKWLGIDITHLSIALQKYRLKDMFGLKAAKDYQVLGEPQVVSAARQLAKDDRYQFQWWALSLVKARPVGGSGKTGKKGADKGIDGIIYFIDEKGGKAKPVLIQVKSGKVGSALIRDLRGAMERENAAIAVFISLENPTKDMQTEAVTAGFYHSPGWDKKYPKLQILTIEQLLGGAEIQMPPASITFKQAEKSSSSNSGDQKELF
ncbi:MAG: site-specific DNA-methyltransferase [Calditrichaeota bacterium]|nr:MAG: site-specific DNA-methyltransferase [Calditrichota bacterium]MBL1206845.1 site-specific DNA-methyltransferase [Calditrichota bacterium]NOG46672.1 site-specific DNA-methyltransferase [Calditrichota bacterium]